MNRLAIYSVIVFLISSTCSRYPDNPTQDAEIEESASVRHLNTEYVECDLGLKGSLATKINVMVFEVMVTQTPVRAVEFFGRAIIEGPPDHRTHAVHFRTDSVLFHPDLKGYEFRTFESIRPGIPYTLYRPKLPTNEYVPFHGKQGMVMAITIDEVWAIQEDGVRMPIALDVSE